MVNKSGWFKVFEASLATMLIMGSFLFLLNQTDDGSDFLEETRDLRIKNILENIDLNVSLRESILEGETEPLSNYFEGMLGDQNSYNFEVYPLGEESINKYESDKEVISYSRIISAEGNTYSPRLIVLNIYEN
jgi:hypothetical protein